VEHHVISLIGVLIFLVFLAAFFSLAETSFMAMNRYKLRHLAKENNRSALRIQKFLTEPDRLLGVISVGNNCANIVASAIATLLAERYFRLPGAVALTTGALTLLILVFSEVAPKTLAATYPDRVAYKLSMPFYAIRILLYPLVWLVNVLSNGFLGLFGMRSKGLVHESLSADELRTVVHEASGKIHVNHQRMLLRILDLERISVDDVMIPKSRVQAIDISKPWPEVLSNLFNIAYNRIPVYYEDWNDLRGLLHVRSLLPLSQSGQLTLEHLLSVLEAPQYLPQGTLLHTQIVEFQKHKGRAGFVVDEYGEIEGLVTLEDILEEMIGEFTTDVAPTFSDIHLAGEGSFLVNGAITMRALNRIQQWNLPDKGAKTLSGQIIDHLGSIPTIGTTLRMSDFAIEVVQMDGHRVKSALIQPLRNYWSLQ